MPMRVASWTRWIAPAALAAGIASAAAQQSFYERFRSNNARMSELQPAMVTPLVAADPRLIQYARLSVASQYTPAGTHTVNFGNARGLGVIAGRRFEFDYIPPPYIEHNTATAADGTGDTCLAGKVRIASGNAEHGNFDIAATLNHSFATGSYKNGTATDTPTLAGVFGFHRRFDLIAALGGTLPTGKISAQGRTLVWNTAAQAHASRMLWLEFENNATFYFSGSHDGLMQNFVTPAAFFVPRSKSWKSTHAYTVWAAGMQIATSGFHTCNHNLISEMRIVF